MAVPILYLDADDEITSAAARIRATEADRVAVVLPYGSRLATSRINFRLLAREAAERGKAIEIVAADASARALAASAGLPVHASVAAFEAAGATGGPGGGVEGSAAAIGSVAAGVPGPTPAAESGTDEDAPTSVILVPRRTAEPVPIVGRPRPPLPTRVAVAIAAGIVGIFVVGALLAFTLLPSAAIELAPRSQDLGPLSVSVEARPDITTPDQQSLQIPSRRYPFDVAVSQTFTTTGVKVTEATATGSVTFRNCDPSSGVIIPAGSKVATASGIQFATSAGLSIRKASFQPPSTVNCRTGSVAVKALVAGPAGNVAADLIRQVPASFDPTLLYVTNQDPTTGGVHDETPQVSQADVDGALATLNAALGDALDAKVDAATGIPAGTTLFPETKVLGATTPTVGPATLVGREVATFELGLSAQGSVIGVDASPVHDLAVARLGSRVTAGFSLAPQTIVIDIGAPEVVGEVVTFPVSMRATEVRDVDAAALLAAVRGMDLPAARAKLDDFGDVTISVWPDWVTAIPSNPSRVTLSLASPRPAASPTP